MDDMPLTLVLGPANSAKAGEVFAAFGAAARRGALLVVPTARDAEYYSRELAGERAVLGSILTFAGLLQEIARRVGYRPRPVSALQRELVMARAAISNASPLNVSTEPSTAPPAASSRE